MCERSDDRSPAGRRPRSPRRIRSASCGPTRRRSAMARQEAGARRRLEGRDQFLGDDALAAQAQQEGGKALAVVGRRRSCQRLRQLVAHLVRGEVELAAASPRRSGCACACRSVPSRQLGRLAAEAQPVIGQAAAVGALVDPHAVDQLALAVTRCPHLVRRAVREIDVEEARRPADRSRSASRAAPAPAPRRSPRARCARRPATL